MVGANRAAYWVTTHWGIVFGVFLFLFVATPFFAPIFMRLGWENAGKLIYLLYTPLCHQMPQRSFFLFGEQPMYSLEQIQAVHQISDNPFVLRRFIGTAGMGWKVAWSDRMVAMYGSLLIAGIPLWGWRDKLKPLPLWGLGLFLLPMALDGTTHVISDFIGGVGDGFRYHNNWLAVATNHAFSATFYAGDVLGSFNSIMRLMSGLSFGIGVVWFLLPHLHATFADSARQMSENLPPAACNFL